MTTSREKYQREFYSLICRLAENFTKDQCQRLGYIYQNLFTASFYDQNADDTLKLLDYLLKERKLFSLDKPEKLASMMDDLGYSEKREMVELFIEEHKDIIPAFSVRGRALPPTPEPVQEETEGPYVVFEVPMSPTASTTSGTGPPVSSEDQTAPSGEELYITPNHHQSPQLPRLVKPRLSPLPSRAVKAQQALQHSRSAKPCSSPLVVTNVPLLGVGSDSYNSTDDEDSIYEEIHLTRLKHLSHEIPPLLVECMEFPVSQLREMMGKSEGELVKSGSIPCPILGFTFLLELNPSHQRTMSAKLLLSTDQKSKYLSKLYYQVELSISQSQDQTDKRPGPRTDNLLYSASKVMERIVPPQGGPTPSAETHAEVPTGSTGQSAVTEHNQATKHEDTHACVAYFPHVISHHYLMDKRLVSKPYLVFTFKLWHKHLS